jgi:cell cycle sensor histidine kinase DivJ
VAKSRFLAAVSHELRTPLNSIIGFSDMLVHGMAGEFADARQREYVELIRESGTHLLSVVNAILDVSKIEAGAYSIRPEPFVVAEAIELCRSMMAQQAHDQGVRLTAEVTPGTGEICADRRAVQQIMLNLLSNAVKFTPAGGEVGIEVQRRGSRLRLAVRDTGIGIAEEDLGRLGQPFMQVRNDFTRQFDGTGLGLSLVKGLVRLHEGEMTIECAPGEGTTVAVMLPVAGPAAAQPHQRPALVADVDIGGFDEEFRKTA